MKFILIQSSSKSVLKIVFLISFLFIISSPKVIAQTKTTFFNKKIVVDGLGTGTYQFLYFYKNFYDENLRKVSKAPMFGYGGQIFFATSNKFMIGFSYLTSRGYVSGPISYKKSTYENYELMHERLTMKLDNYALLFSFGGNESNFPSGLSFTTGLAFINTSFVDKEYNYKFPNNLVTPEIRTSFDNSFDQNVLSYKSKYIGFIFEPAKRVSLTKSLAFYYGFRIQLAFRVGAEYIYGSESAVRLENKEINDFVRSNIATFKTGLSFMF